MNVTPEQYKRACQEIKEQNKNLVVSEWSEAAQIAARARNIAKENKNENY